MLVDLQTRAATTADRSLDREAVGRGSFEWDSFVATSHPASPADGTTTDRVVLKRGPKLMVLFRGSPGPTVVSALRRAGVTIGLALSPGELPAVRGLDDYGYMFVSSKRCARSAGAEAVADLERNNWSVDDNPV